MNKYYCSNGIRVSQASIDRRYSESLREKHAGKGIVMCECCQSVPATDNDHTIAKARCKELHKTELIWDKDNFVSSCRKCHRQWESYKDGAYKKHANYESRMDFLRQHDKEGYQKRTT